MDQKNERKMKLRSRPILIIVFVLILGIVTGNLMPDFFNKDQTENKDMSARRLTTGSSTLQRLNAVIFFQGTKEDLKSADITPNIAERLMLDGRVISESSLGEIFGTISEEDIDKSWMRCQNHYNGYIDNNWKPDCIWINKK